MRTLFAVSATALALISAPVAANEQANIFTSNITEDEVFNAQKGWCSALVEISAANMKGGQAQAKKLAEQVIDSAYAYDNGGVLFKPTLTVAPQTFRSTREGAVAYFVGGDSNFPNDSGFALGDWTKCDVMTDGILLMGNAAVSMGQVTVTNKQGQATTVDKTWGWMKDGQGNLRIVLHHSSLEHTGK